MCTKGKGEEKPGCFKPGCLHFLCGSALFSAVKQRGRENRGPQDIAPKILVLKRAKMVLCPFHRSHREICTRNRPVSETKFLDDFCAPLLSWPLCFTANFCALLRTCVCALLRAFTYFCVRPHFGNFRLFEWVWLQNFGRCFNQSSVRTRVWRPF